MQQKKVCISPKNGFTLIELLVVILIIGILTSVAIPQYQKAIERSRATQAVTLLKTVAEALEVYYLTNGDYNTDFSKLNVDMASWTGNSKWFESVSLRDTHSNANWSLQLLDAPEAAGVYVGRLSGPYRGTGFVYYLSRPNGDLPIKKILCMERRRLGVSYSGERGSYCQRVWKGRDLNYSGTSAYVFTFR